MPTMTMESVLLGIRTAACPKGHAGPHRHRATGPQGHAPPCSVTAGLAMACADGLCRQAGPIAPAFLWQVPTCWWEARG